MTQSSDSASDLAAALRADARAVLVAWTPGDAEQRALRDSYVEFLDGHPDAMWRACVDGHLTGSTLVLSHDRSHVLLTLHSKIKRWLQMGGHCEQGDTSMRAAAGREALEESGIAGLRLSDLPVRLDRHRVACHGGSWHLDVQYAAMAPPGAVPVISDESVDLRWWPVTSLPADTDDSVRRLVEVALHPR